MAKLSLPKGMDEFLNGLEYLYGDAEKMMGHAIHEGAAVVADEIRKEIQSIKIDNGKTDNGRMKDGLTSSQRKGLLDGLGIASMRSDGDYLHVKIGFDGYNRTKTDTWPKGQPNVMIARSMICGQSFQKRNDFISRAYRRVKARALVIMEQELDNQITERIR